MTIDSIFSTSRTIRVFRKEDRDDNLDSTEEKSIRFLSQETNGDDIKVERYNSLTGTVFALKYRDEVVKVADFSQYEISLKILPSDQLIVLVEGIPKIVTFERRNDMNKLAWLERLEFKHKTWLVVLSFMAFIGLVDLLQLAITGTTILHPFNDILLILGSLALSATVAMVAMEE